jgi:hypothetical protein
MSNHKWRFFRAGGFPQVTLESAADLKALAELDQKLWVALACPVRGNAMDAATLAMVDGDGDGRIRAPELLTALSWSDKVFRDLGALLRREDGISPDALREDTEEGRAVRASAQRILEGRGQGEKKLTVAAAAAAAAVLHAQPFNGDGVVPASSAEGEAAALIGEIIAAVGGVADCGGQPGVSADSLGRFWAALEGYDA